MKTVMRIVGVLLLVVLAAACAKKKAPTATAPPPTTEAPPAPVETPTPVVSTPPPTPVPPPTTRVEAPKPIPAVSEDSITNRSLEELSALLKPVFFAVDSFDLDSTAQAIASANADVLRKNPAWKVTIEGHADERGTPEYNLALGERRANAVKAYLVSLGVIGDRLQTLSYGEEFPFDAGHNEGAWSKNRRAYFQITAK
jgi:peptidoglycan-associated lipoprotein